VARNGGQLCIPCLQVRIGRLLTGADLTLVKINWPHQADTPRLAELKRERWGRHARS
jgi:hypothetical protein